jgi:uncharacterized cupredoxin-like copper-binding protein
MVSVLACAHVAWAHDARQHDQPAQTAKGHAGSFGMPGSARNISQTIAIHMTDAMRFSPETFAVVPGETVRLYIANDGKVAHEFVLGTPGEIAEHEQMMRRMPQMAHTEANAVRVEPGQAADIVWKFSAPGNFVYACLLPGHHEAGMQGTITVKARGTR